MISKRRNTGVNWRANYFSKALTTWLHLVLVVGVFAYLYSPLLDHMLGKDNYARPHTHVQLSDNVLLQLSNLHENHALEGHSHHDDGEGGVVCLLNIDSLLSILLSIVIVPYTPAGPHDSLIAGVMTTYLEASPVYLSSPDPPPNI